jgi:hypothetical protein
MEKSQKGWWTADVPASAVKGKSIQYYVEAVGTTGDVIAANGRDDSPEIIYIVNPQPTAEATHQEVQPLAPPPPELRRKPGSWFGGLYLGHGYGWHPKSDLEYYNGEKAAAGGADEAGPGHIGLQAGYQLTDELAFSLVTRSQYIPKSGNDPNRTGHPANGAHALLVKGEYDFAGEQHLFYAGGMLGVGAFRLGFEPNTDRGILTNDTVKGGPILLGPMGGAMYNFKGHLTAFGELGVLFGIGDSALIADLNIGLQYRL